MRVIVAQAPLGPRGARTPLVAERHAQLPVGVARGTYFTTAIVKLTMRYELVAGQKSCVAELVSDAVPLSSADFVNYKPAADVMLVGHAFADQALEGIAAAIAFGEFDKKVLVTGPSPREAMALPRSLGPHEPKTVASADIAQHARSRTPPAGPGWDDLVPTESMDPDSGWSQADPSQRTTWLVGDEVLNVWGLTRGGGSTQIKLPGLRPVGCFEANSGAYMLAAWCDTLLIDTDDQRIVTTWRAHVPVMFASEELSRIVLSLEPVGAERALEEIMRDLPHGLFFRASESEDQALTETQKALPQAMIDDGELRAARCSTWTEFPDPLLTHEEYLRLKTAIRKQRGRKKELLQEMHIDDDDWTLEERHWATHEVLS